MSHIARKRLLWTGFILAVLGFVPAAPRPAYAGLAALDAFHVGRYHLANGDRDKAMESFNDALRLNPQFVQAYVARGKLFAEMGQHESALVDLNFALRLQPTHAEAFAYRGYALLSLGQPQKAVPDLDMALRIDPSYARVHFLRGQAMQMLGEPQAASLCIATARRLDPTLEVSQVVAASTDGTIDDVGVQLAGGTTPQRTPIMTELVTAQTPQPAIDPKSQGRLVPFENHPDLADVAPPKISRKPELTKHHQGLKKTDNVQAKQTKPAGPRPLPPPPALDSVAGGSTLPDITSNDESTDPIASADRSVESAEAIEPAAPIVTEPTAVASAPPPSVDPLPMIELSAEPVAAIAESTPSGATKVEESPAKLAADAESPAVDTESELTTDLVPEPQMIPSFGPQIFAKSNHASASDGEDLVDEAGERIPMVAKASEILGGQIPETLLLPAKPSAVEGDNRLAAAVEAAKLATQIDAPAAFADDEEESAEPAKEQTAPSAADVAKANEQVKIGVACEADGNTVDALAAYQRALELSPLDAQIYCRRGHLLLEELRTAEALADFERAVKLAPGLANGYFGRAHVRFQTENFAEAIGDYDVALRLDDQHSQALFERGYCKFKLGDIEKARVDRRAAIDLDPTLAKAEPKYAVDSSRQLAQSKLDGATAFAGDDDHTPTAIATDEAPTTTSTNAVSISVDSIPVAAFDALFGGATQLKVAGQTAQSLQAQATVVEIACNLPAEEQAKLNAEIEQLSTDLLTMPGDRDRYFRRARAYCLLGRPVDALDDLNAALRFDSEMPEALKLRAEVHRQLDRRDAAQADFNRLIELNPSDASAFVLRAEYSAEIGQFDAALADLNRAVELNPGDAAALEERSRIHAERGNFDQSHADHQRAVNLGNKTE